MPGTGHRHFRKADIRLATLPCSGNDGFGDEEYWNLVDSLYLYTRVVQ